MSYSELMGQSVNRSSEKPEEHCKEMDMDMKQYQLRIVKIGEKQFLSLIKNQKKLDESLKNMRKEIEVLTKRVSKCEHALKRKHKHHHSHTQLNDQYFEFKQEGKKQLCNRCKHAQHGKNQRNHLLYATFGKQDNHKSSQIKRLYFKGSGSTDQLMKKKSQLATNNIRKKMQGQYWENPEVKGYHDNSKSSWNSEQKLRRLRSDIQDVTKTKRKQKIGHFVFKSQEKAKQKQRKRNKNKVEQLGAYSNIYFSKN